MKSAVTASLVPEARGGPFVFWDDLSAAFAKAAQLGYDAVEVFAPSPQAVSEQQLRQLTEQHQLRVAAVGTGAGMVIHGLSLVDPDSSQRQKAIEFIRSMIGFGGPFQAPAIIGSMQGKWSAEVDRATALGYLSDALNMLGEFAKPYGVPLIYEPLNRYETNLITTMSDGAELLRKLDTDNVKLLADLFHMNIEETNVADGIRAAAGFIGHVHFVDSNRRPAGMGHTDFAPIMAALHEIGYEDYLSAEAFPYPDSDRAAEATMEAYRHLTQ